MKSSVLRVINFAVLTILLPCVYGCQGGGANLFGGSGGIAGLVSGGGSSGGDVVISGGSLAAIHGPEPATMMLVGGGLMAMNYFKNKKK